LGGIGTHCVAPGVVSVVHQRRWPDRMRVVQVCYEVGRALVAPCLKKRRLAEPKQ
jgi:hypothetical protein